MERTERREKEEEERRGNEAEALPNCDCDRPYVVSCFVFVRLSVSFVFKD